jgi:hypothetical protein
VEPAVAGDTQAEVGERESEPLAPWGLRFRDEGTAWRGSGRRRVGDATETGFVGAAAGIVLHALDDPTGDPGIHEGASWGNRFSVTTKSITLVSSPVKWNDW